MTLNINDLTEHEKRLNEIIEHAEKEREAIRLLIKGMRLRNSVLASGDEALAHSNGSKAPSIAQGVINQINHFEGKWFTVRVVTGNLIRMGIGNLKDEAKLRPVVANYLKKHFDNKVLERRNIGSEASPTYEYRKYEKSRLF